ncbi:MAG: phospho-sugar mutase [Bacteroidetes bacterium]|nr:phospho-sugar mutase [Bacteroidota bacterium]
MEAKEKALKWLNGQIDEGAKKEIHQMLEDNDPTELNEAFYKDLEFGTGGLRGIMGIGSNRMNKYTVGMATQGLSNYLLNIFPGNSIKVAIAHDSRNKSDYFTEVAASVLSANGIKVYVFKELRPTPELSYAIRHYGCKSGIVVTASHNPKEYNGYKVYWDDGSQIISPHDKNIIEEVAKIGSFDEVKFEKDSSLIAYIGDELDDIYLAEIENVCLSKSSIKNQHDLKIVYTPIHGTGITVIPKILAKLGFDNLHIVEEQSKPDGNFPTVVYPNPEEEEAMSMGLKKAREIDADLVLATDPDADRVGIAVKNNHGEFQLINGNQTVALYIYYMLTRWKELGKLDGNQFIVNTIVTTDLIDKIAERFGVDNYTTLTGFKHIAGVIRELEGKKKFIGGGEESYGLMVSDFVRDKDAVAACSIIAEMAAYAKDQGSSQFDMMIDMYVEFGFYKEKLISLVKKGISGAEEIQKIMKDLRANPPSVINSSKLVKLIDYQTKVEKNLITGEEKPVQLPESNVLQFFTEDGSKISARPSGTEPKIKFYFSVNKPLDSAQNFDQVNAELDQKIELIITDMGLN